MGLIIIHDGNLNKNKILCENQEDEAILFMQLEAIQYTWLLSSQEHALEYILKLYFLFKILSLSLSLSFCLAFCVFASLPLFSLIFALFFFSRMCCPYTTEGLLIPSSSSFPTFMINGDFWGFMHCSSQSFINKCDCAKQVSLINAKMTVAEVSIGFLRQLCISHCSSSIARQVHHPRQLSKCLILGFRSVTFLRSIVSGPSMRSEF